LNIRRYNFFSYKQLTLAIIAASLLISVLVGYFASFLLKEAAIAETAKVDAKKSSLLVFESLYSVMEKGATKSDLNKIVKRLNGAEHDMNLSVYRSEKVAQLFGDIAADKKLRESDENIKRAIKGEEILTIDKDNIRYLYPVKTKPECLSCHTNVGVNEVNGVIDISYPITNLKLSLSGALNYFFILLVFFFAITYLFFYLGLNKFLIEPLAKFILDVKKAANYRETDKKLHISSRIYELKNLEKSFNKMLTSMSNSRRKELEQIYKDHITGLPNRLKLHEELRGFSMPFLMILNIDAFKEVNDFYGVKVGDFILKKVGDTISAHAKLGEKIYRFAGDEYAVLLEAHKVPVDEKAYITEFLNAVKSEVVRYGEHEISVHLTAGVAIGGASILENADMALKEAKKSGKHIVFFDPSMQLSKQYEHNIIWTKKLKEAITNSMLQPYYQPIMEIKSGKIAKYEALARLIDETGAPIAPRSFLSVAKKSKLYPYLTKAIVEHTFIAFEDTEFEFAINISVEDIEDEVTRDFIYEKLSKYPNPTNAIFEITESEGIENFTEVLKFIRCVKTIGAKIAIDDFGSGYSNFAYLLKLQVDYIKIDASIIKNITIDRNSYIITKTIVDFCSQMGIKTVAEFVCDKEILDAVAELGVDYAQGYYIGEPLKEIKK